MITLSPRLVFIDMPNFIKMALKFLEERPYQHKKGRDTDPRTFDQKLALFEGFYLEHQHTFNLDIQFGHAKLKFKSLI